MGEHRPRSEDLAWCAGMLAVFGSFSQARVNSRGQHGKYFMTLKFRRKRDPYPLERFRRTFKLQSRVHKTTIGETDVWVLRVTGGNLELIIEELWPYLSQERRKEYLELDTIIQQRNRTMENVRKSA